MKAKKKNTTQGGSNSSERNLFTKAFKRTLSFNGNNVKVMNLKSSCLLLLKSDIVKGKLKEMK